MLERPLFSVVIPTYNCAQYLEQSVRSALDQTLPKEQVEVLVLDDGSADETPGLMRRFGDRVRYVRLPHGGVSKARNTGIQMARGTYVAFLDADDYWFPQRLERVLEVLRSEDRIFVNTEYYFETGGKRWDAPFFRSRSFACMFQLNPRAQFEFALEENFIHTMSIVPRTALLEVGGYNERLRYGEDWDLWLRLLEAGYAVRLAPEPCAVYRYMRPGASTTRHDYAMARDRLFVLSQYPQSVSPYRLKKARLLAHWYRVQHALRRFAPAHQP